MLEGLFQSTTVPALQQVADFCEARHTVLAGNLANQHTPGYRMRDMSVENFQKRLQTAIQTRRQPPLVNGAVSPGGAAPGQAFGQRSDMASVSKNSQSLIFHDQNNIDVEQQVSAMVKNQLLHNTALSIMTSQFRLLESAISERV